MTIGVQSALPATPVEKARRPSRYAFLQPYIIEIRPLRGGDLEHYWIEGRSKTAAINLAARLAGVSPDRVMSAARFTLTTEERS